MICTLSFQKLMLFVSWGCKIGFAGFKACEETSLGSSGEIHLFCIIGYFGRRLCSYTCGLLLVLEKTADKEEPKV